VRHFTRAEADALLPMIGPVLEDLRPMQRRMQEVLDALEDDGARMVGNGHGAGQSDTDLQAELQSLRHEMEQRLRFLHGIGVQLKDIEVGIVDFPTRMHDRDVCLCWRLGEPRVSHWHEMDGGYGGRRGL
jgi:hypothetical protein